MSVVLYLGRKGCGKSYLMRRHVYESTADVRAFLIMDRDGEGTWDGPCYTHPAQVRALDRIPRFVVFQKCKGSDVAELAIQLGDCVLVDEEVHRTIAERPWRPWDPRTAEGRRGHPLHTFLHEGRHVENLRGEVGTADALVATHRPANLPPDFPALCDAIYLGQLTSYPDAKRVYQEGWEPGTSVREVRLALTARRRGEFRRWPVD